MRIYRLHCEMLTKSSLEQTFAIFEDPYNLATITPRWLNFQVTSPNRVQMRKGAQIEYTIRWLGLPIRWKTIILEYDPPFLFVDEQEKGPYALWRHRHTFESTEHGTKVGDHVEYALPFGPLGTLAHSLVVRRQLLEIFDYRQQQLGKMLGRDTQQIVKPYIR
jgi:ligand-binding SRPBCC domain-containing protein